MHTLIKANVSKEMAFKLFETIPKHGKPEAGDTVIGTPVNAPGGVAGVGYLDMYTVLIQTISALCSGADC